MLVTLLNWIYIFATSYIIGAFCLPRLAELIDHDSRLVFNWCDDVIAGLVCATVFAELFSLVSGVGFIANLILIVCCVIFIVIDKRKIFEALRHFLPQGRPDAGIILLLVLQIMLFILILMYTAESTFHYDTGLYHAQAIHWIEDYGVIKGLGHLHVRLAYNSAFFPLCALYSMRDITGGQSLHGVNGFIFAIMCVYSVYGWIGTVKNKGKELKNTGSHAISSCLRFAPIVYLLLCLLEITSPESDFITVNLIIWIFMRLTEIYEEEADNDRLAGYCLIAVCTFALVSYKLSASIITVITVWPLMIMIRKKKWKGIAVCAVLAVMMVLPYLIRNVIICGWLVYPVDKIDLFNVPWKFTRETLLSDAQEIGQWADAMNVSGGGVLYVLVWILSWWQEQDYTARMLTASMLISVPVIIVAVFDRTKWFIKFLMFVMLLSLVFYLFKAPLIRYCYGPVIVLPLMVIGYFWDSSITLFRRASKKHRKMWIPSFVFSILVSVMILYPSVYSLKELIKYDYEESMGRFSHKDHLIRQIDYPKADVKELDWYGYRVYLPKEGDQCWYYAFPSSPYHECFEGNRPAAEGIQYGIENMD